MQVRHDDALSRFAAHWGLGTRDAESATSTSTSSGPGEEEGILAGAVRLEGASDGGDYTGCPVVSRFVLRLTSFDHTAFEALQVRVNLEKRGHALNRPDSVGLPFLPHLPIPPSALVCSRLSMP
jgi:hypothetical protein